MTPLRVLVADDHARTRADIAAAIDAHPRLEVCAVAADAAAAVIDALRERPDLCVLDIRMPGGGIAATWEITARLRETKVVMLTVSRDDDDLFHALSAGASGYLLKDADFDELAGALLDVAAGEAAIPGPLVARLVEEFRDRGPRRRTLVGASDRLTGREWEVLELLRRGLTTSEIATRLFISPVTVRTHVSSILRKLRAPDRAAALAQFSAR